MTWKNTFTAVAIMAATFGLLTYLSNPEIIIPTKPFSTFPTRIDKWVGIEQRFDERIYQVLGVDDSFYADYQSPDGSWVNLYIGYYQSQREGDLIHSPKNCMPGGGWNIVESKVVPLNIKGNSSPPINIIKLVLQNGSKRQISYYWYQSRGRIISSEYLQKVYLVWDAITRNRTDGSFVRLIAPVNKDENETIAVLEEFTRNLFPILKDFIPS